jgi:hypothetical protein
MSGTVTVKVLCNLASHMGPYWTHGRQPPYPPYRAGDRLHTVMVFDCPFPACGHVERLLAIIWGQLGTTDDPKTPWAKAYREQHHRRLDVGDVVVISERAFAVEQGGGWAAVTVNADQIWPFPKLFPRMVEGYEITIANYCDLCGYSHDGPCPV